MIFPFTIKIIVRMLYFLKKNLFKILLRSYKILCKILQDYETFLSHNLVRSYIRILTKILVKILNKIFCLGTTGFDHIPSWSKIGSHLVVMDVVIDNMHGHVRLYTSSTQVCLFYFNVPLVLTTPFPAVR